MVRKQSVIITLVFLLFLSSVFALDSGCVHYFYANGCEMCDNIQNTLATAQNNNPILEVFSYEVYHTPKNAKVLEQYFKEYNIPKESQGIPAMFIDDTYFIGETPINDFFTNQLSERTTIMCPPIAENKTAVGIVGENEPFDVREALSFWTITKSGIKDSFRPVMIAFLLIVLASLSGIKDEDKIVMNGGFFGGVLFLIILLTGFSIIPTFSQKIAFFFYRIIGVIIIFVGLVKIKGIVTTWKKLLSIFPEEIRKDLVKGREHILSPYGIVIIAFLAALFTVSDKTNILTLLEALFSQFTHLYLVVPLLLYYSLLLLLPTIGIVVALHLIKDHLYEEAEEEGKHSSARVKRLKKHYHQIVNASASGVMIIVGLILLFV